MENPSDYPNKISRQEIEDFQFKQKVVIIGIGAWEEALGAGMDVIASKKNMDLIRILIDCALLECLCIHL